MAEVPSNKFSEIPKEDKRFKCGICPFSEAYALGDRPCDKCAVAQIAISLNALANILLVHTQVKVGFTDYELEELIRRLQLDADEYKPD